MVVKSLFFFVFLFFLFFLFFFGFVSAFLLKRKLEKDKRIRK